MDPARYSRESNRALFETAAEHGQLNLCRNRQVDGYRGADHEHTVSLGLPFLDRRSAKQSR
jgi:hypothetical protein